MSKGNQDRKTPMLFPGASLSDSSSRPRIGIIGAILAPRNQSKLAPSIYPVTARQCLSGSKMMVDGNHVGTLFDYVSQESREPYPEPDSQPSSIKQIQPIEDLIGICRLENTVELAAEVLLGPQDFVSPLEIVGEEVYLEDETPQNPTARSRPSGRVASIGMPFRMFSPTNGKATEYQGAVRICEPFPGTWDRAAEDGSRFAQAGDAGALVRLEDGGAPVGLVVGGGPGFVAVAPLADITRRLELTLADQEAARQHNQYLRHRLRAKQSSTAKPARADAYLKTTARIRRSPDDWHQILAAAMPEIDKQFSEVLERDAWMDPVGEEAIAEFQKRFVEPLLIAIGVDRIRAHLRAAQSQELEIHRGLQNLIYFIRVCGKGSALISEFEEAILAEQDRRPLFEYLPGSQPESADEAEDLALIKSPEAFDRATDHDVAPKIRRRLAVGAMGPPTLEEAS